MFVNIFNTDKKYNIIYADPPWQYNSRMALGHGAKRSSAEDYYNVMTLEEICGLQGAIDNITADDCVLFMWVTFPKLYEAQYVLGAWGFTYKTVAFNWVKRNKIFNPERANEHGGIDDFMGQGRWTRQNAEICLLATKGKPKRQSAKVRQIIYSPIREHSRKPDETRDRIVELCGDIPRIELFARQFTDGWDCWGDEVERDMLIV